MPVSYSTYNTWSPQLQRRYRRRYGSAPARGLSPTQQTNQAQAPNYPSNPPQGGGAPGGTQGAPGAPGTPLPFDQGYENTVNAINTGLGNTLADLTYSEQRLKQEYGFDDPSNPYNAARMLRRAFEQRQTGTQNSYAARGQLYAGSLVNARNENQFGYNRDYDTLRRQYDDALRAITSGRTRAQEDAIAGIVDAGLSATERASAERPEDPGPPEQQQSGQGVSWDVWRRWSPAQRERYRRRHRRDWNRYRPR